MIIKSKAPFRIGLAGGGSDVDPYTTLYGGEVVNATIGLFARTAIESTDDSMIYIEVSGTTPVEYELRTVLPITGATTDLVSATYNRFVKDHGFPGGGLAIYVNTEVPLGSGLGTSSTIVVSLCGAFLKLFGLHWEPLKIAEYAYDIERADLGWAGGRQDQYAALVGGFNHLIFGKNGSVEVDHLQPSAQFISMLEQSMILYYSNQQRNSQQILEEQKQHIRNHGYQEIEATHQLKALAIEMKKAITSSDILRMAEVLDKGFHHKKKIASGISSPVLENIYDAAIDAGAIGGKISGAGGGGFILFFSPPSKREAVKHALTKFDGREFPFYFVDKGLTTWTE